MTAALLAPILFLPASGGSLAAQIPGQAVVPTGSLGAVVTGEDFDFYAYGPYRQGVPRPSEVLGYEPGSFHARYGLIERYFEALGRSAPDRIVVETYGESYERRPLLLAYISSQENLARKDQIRQAVGRLADLRGTSEEEAARIAAETPIVVWLNYGTDGEESAATEAALQVAYQLVAGDSQEMRRFRDEALIILTPVQNPESHQRFVFWYNAFGIGDEHPLTLEKHPPWGISNDNNHYQIDLNRDAHAQTQMESQALGVRVLRWRPQVFADHHGQTSTYYFPPPVLPINPDLPRASFRWLEAFGRGNAEAFDRYGWQYWTRDVFDHFYPGYWETWPSLMGATGMTYETTGGGRFGFRHRRSDGTLLTLRLGIAQHFVASLATVRTSVEHREARLLDFHAFFRSGMEEASRSPERVIVLEGERDRRRTAALVSSLLRHGIEVDRSRTSFRVEAVSHQTGRRESRDFGPGTYVVDLAQPASRIASTLLRRHRAMQDEFLASQYARWARNARRGAEEPREGYEFYDVTSWSLPLTWGVPAWSAAVVPRAEMERISVPWEALPTTGDWTGEVLFPVPALEGAGVQASALPDGELSARARNTYVWSPETEGSVRLLASLLKEGYVVNVARRPLEVGGREFPVGSFVVRVERNPESLHRRIGSLAQEAQVRVHAFHSGLQERGQWGVGGNPVVPIQAPRILVLADDGVSETSYGSTWFTLERRLGYPFTPVRFAQLRQLDLSEFQAIVLPDGSGAAYRRGLGEEGVERLEAWIRAGGTLVTWGGGAAFAVRAELLSSSILGEEERESQEEADACLADIDALVNAGTPAGPATMSPSARPCALQPLSGAVLAARPDPTHWLVGGLGEATLPVLARGNSFLSLSERGATPLVFETGDALVVSGFVWPGNTGRWLGGQAYAVVDPLGEGQVVAFSSDSLFRAFWRSTARLFANGVLLGPSMTSLGRRSW